MRSFWPPPSCCKPVRAGAWPRSGEAPAPRCSWGAGRRPRSSRRSRGGPPGSSSESRSPSRSCRPRAGRRARCSKATSPLLRRFKRRRCPCKPRRRNRNSNLRPRRRPIADRHPAYVLLEDGAWFPGISPLPFEPAYAEVVFTTNLSGYQEVFTDPSYLGQLVVMTAPMIGNYGINPEDVESDRPRVAGVVVRELSGAPSNWRSTGPLLDWLAGAKVPLVADVDTRQLTRHIRSRGAMRGVLALGEQPPEAIETALAASPSMNGLDLASVATIPEAYSEGPADAKHHVVAFDFGMKRNILRLFVQHGCRVTVVPAATTAAQVRRSEEHTSELQSPT